jgi:hypothetical protein
MCHKKCTLVISQRIFVVKGLKVWLKACPKYHVSSQWEYHWICIWKRKFSVVYFRLHITHTLLVKNRPTKILSQNTRMILKLGRRNYTREFLWPAVVLTFFLKNTIQTQALTYTRIHSPLWMHARILYPMRTSDRLSRPIRSWNWRSYHRRIAIDGYVASYWKNILPL